MTHHRSRTSVCAGAGRRCREQQPPGAPTAAPARAGLPSSGRSLEPAGGPNRRLGPPGTTTKLRGTVRFPQTPVGTAEGCRPWWGVCPWRPWCGGGEARSCQPPQELRLLLVRRLILRWTLAPPLGATKYGRFYPSSQLGPSPEHTLSSRSGSAIAGRAGRGRPIDIERHPLAEIARSGGVRACVTWPCYVTANVSNGSRYPSR